MSKGKIAVEVTEEEYAALTAMREERADRIRQQALHLMGVAARYQQWLIENGAGSTYSTFCDDFGYQGQPNEDRPRLYDAVMALINTSAARTEQVYKPKE